jgi:hypothetical protein
MLALSFGPDRQRRGEPNGLHLQARAGRRNTRRSAEARFRRTDWSAGDTIPLGRDTILRVIDVRPGEEPDEDPVLVVETA